MIQQEIKNTTGKKRVELTIKHRWQFLRIALSIRWSAVTFDVANDEIIFHRKDSQ